MAEIRKHRPRTSSIGDQVRANVDTGPRPVEPGEFDEPEFDPFFEEPDDEPAGDQPEIEFTSSAAAAVGTSDWFSFESDAMQAMLAGSGAAPDAADPEDQEPDEDADDE